MSLTTNEEASMHCNAIEARVKGPWGRNILRFNSGSLASNRLSVKLSAFPCWFKIYLGISALLTAAIVYVRYFHG